MTDLPQLPDPGFRAVTEVNKDQFAPVHCYTADQMREYARKAVEAARAKDHEVAQLVNRLTAIAQEFGQTQQLRERIAAEIRPARLIL